MSGSRDNTDLELFNGRTNLYLQVKQVGHGYKVKVAERPLVSDACVLYIPDISVKYNYFPFNVKILKRVPCRYTYITINSSLCNQQNATYI